MTFPAAKLHKWFGGIPQLAMFDEQRTKVWHGESLGSQLGDLVRTFWQDLHLSGSSLWRMSCTPSTSSLKWTRWCSLQLRHSHMCLAGLAGGIPNPRRWVLKMGDSQNRPFFVGTMIVDHQIAVPNFPCQMSNFFVLQNRSVECHGDKTQWDPKAKYSGNNLSIA